MHKLHFNAEHKRGGWGRTYIAVGIFGRYTVTHDNLKDVQKR